VLYAEDNQDSGDMLRTLLGYSDIDVSLARSVTEAFSAAQNGDFDLYLLDSNFPEGNGLDLCRRLREFKPETPIVFYSGRAYASDRQDGMDAGASAYVVKPYLEQIAPMIFDLVGRIPEIATIEEVFPILRLRPRIAA
jgi:DNA-binding response OmpR family regulator